MIPALWSRAHYGAHLAPILAALPAGLSADACLVASHRDLVKARKAGHRRFILAQHGAGQSYTRAIAAYPGGDDNADVGLFLVPNEYSAQRWRDAYPGACVSVVGSPVLDTLPERDEAEPETVAVSFHWDLAHTPEAGSAFPWFRTAVAELAGDFRMIGHRHPMQRNLPEFYRRNGIEFVDDFAEVCRRAAVYVCDNSSTLFEFAATGRPVVVMNSPRYRRSVSHGGRFWDWASIGIQVDESDELGEAIARALTDPEPFREERERVLDLVYAYRTGAAQRAADAITAWLS